jgi:hypothetical protein
VPQYAPHAGYARRGGRRGNAVEVPKAGPGLRWRCGSGIAPERSGAVQFRSSLDRIAQHVAAAPDGLDVVLAIARDC